MDIIELTCGKTDFVEDDTYTSKLNAPVRILFRCFSTLLFVPLSLVCMPLYIVGLVIWRRPPTVSPWSRFYSYFTAALTEGKAEEGIPFTNRILIFIAVLDNLIKSPVKGICWFLDEIFYSAYRKCEIKDPLFFISAQRSGSTQLADYLEDDHENFVSPMFIESMYPYIWMWRIIGPVSKFVGLKNYFEAPSSIFGEEMKKRHNTNYFKTETSETPIGILHMTVLSCNLGSSFGKWGFLTSSLKDQPVDREFCNLFIELNDCIMKKVLFHRGLPKQRMFIKSHMLIIARELEQRYNGAKFLTVVRDPIKRFNSLVNFVRVISVDGPLKREYDLSPISWKVIRDVFIESQVCYCEDEMSFYSQCEGNAINKFAVSFDNYVKNLAETFKCVYSFLNIPVSAELLSKAAALQESSHDRTSRKMAYDPQYDRSLSSLGVDEGKLKEYLSEYINWINKLK